MRLDRPPRSDRRYDVRELFEDIEHALDWPQEELYAQDPAVVDALQLHWLQRRFAELRCRVKIN